MGRGYVAGIMVAVIRALVGEVVWVGWPTGRVPVLAAVPAFVSSADSTAVALAFPVVGVVASGAVVGMVGSVVIGVVSFTVAFVGGSVQRSSVLAVFHM